MFCDTTPIFPCFTTRALYSIKSAPYSLKRAQHVILDAYMYFKRALYHIKCARNSIKRALHSIKSGHDFIRALHCIFTDSLIFPFYKRPVVHPKSPAFYPKSHDKAQRYFDRHKTVENHKTVAESQVLHMTFFF